jgi:hypothetical protein
MSVVGVGADSVMIGENVRLNSGDIARVEGISHFRQIPATQMPHVDGDVHFENQMFVRVRLYSVLEQRSFEDDEYPHLVKSTEVQLGNELTWEPAANIDEVVLVAHAALANSGELGVPFSSISDAFVITQDTSGRSINKNKWHAFPERDEWGSTGYGRPTTVTSRTSKVWRWRRLARERAAREAEKQRVPCASNAPDRPSVEAPDCPP